MGISIEEIVELGETNDFLQSARNFCAFIETTEATDDEFLRQLQNLLLNLYQRGLSLPWPTLIHKEEFNQRLSQRKFENVLDLISSKIGMKRYYWDVFDPTQSKNIEAGCGDMVDDIGDIYRDIKNGLVEFDLGTTASIESAVWEMKFSFEKHWGIHAICALKTLHFLLA